jgi:hypothetical protein
MKKAKATSACKKTRIEEKRDDLDGTWALIAPHVVLLQASQQVVDAVRLFKDEVALNAKQAVANKLNVMTTKALKELQKALAGHCEDTRMQALSDVFFSEQTAAVDKAEKIAQFLKKTMRTMTSIAVFEAYMSEEGRTSWDALKADVIDAIEVVAGRAMPA